MSVVLFATRDVCCTGAAKPGAFTLDTGLFVTGVTPSMGSLYGGNTITVTGSGFGSDPAFVLVELISVSDPTLVYVTCVPTSVHPTAIQCILDMAAYLATTTPANVVVSILSIANDTSSGAAAQGTLWGMHSHGGA